MSAHEHNTDMGIDISDIALDLDRDWSISYFSVVEIRIHHHVGCKVSSMPGTSDQANSVDCCRGADKGLTQYSLS